MFRGLVATLYVVVSEEEPFGFSFDKDAKFI